MSDNEIATPRTDAAAFDYEDGEGECVTADFARQLERQIAALELKLVAAGALIDTLTRSNDRLRQKVDRRNALVECAEAAKALHDGCPKRVRNLQKELSDTREAYFNQSARLALRDGMDSQLPSETRLAEIELTPEQRKRAVTLYRGTDGNYADLAMACAHVIFLRDENAQLRAFVEAVKEPVHDAALLYGITVKGET